MESIINKKYLWELSIGIIISSLVEFVILSLYLKGVFLSEGANMIPVLLIAYPVAAFLFFRTFFRIPKVKISKEEISIWQGNKDWHIKWDEIKEINLYGKGKAQMSAIAIETKSSTVVFMIYYAHYSNSNVIAQYIRHCWEYERTNKHIDTNSFKTINLHSLASNSIQADEINFISRVPLAAANTYFGLLGLFGLFKLFTAEYVPVIGIILMSVLIILSFVVGIFGVGMIGLSDKYLVSKNYYLPLKKAFYLEDIQKVTIESSAGVMRIVTKDLKQRKIRVGNFLDKDWRNLENELMKKKVFVTRI